MRLRTTVVAVLAAALVLTAAATASAGRGQGKAPGVEAIFAIRSQADSSVSGLAALKWRAGKLKGFIIATGLTPGLHAMHIHGGGSCAADKAGNGTAPIVAFADLEANANGVAVLQVSIAARPNPLRNKGYLNIHEKSSADGVGVGVICGDVKRRAI